MAPITPTPPIKLLLTGYGAFGSVIDNPSTLAGRKLDAITLSSPPLPLTPHNPHALTQDVLLTPPPTAATSKETFESSAVDLEKGCAVGIEFKALKVTYEEVDSSVPGWHEGGQWDCMVHVGVAGSYPGPGIERGSKRLGYSMTTPDAEGGWPPLTSDGGRGVEGDVERWDSVVDCPELLNYMKTVLGFEHTFISDNPGGYLCGYITAVSLKNSFMIASKTGKLPKPVLFIHVPYEKADGGPYTIDELAEYLKGVCWFVGQQAAKVKMENR